MKTRIGIRGGGVRDLPALKASSSRPERKAARAKRWRKAYDLPRKQDPAGC